ncbi:UDP-glucuronic acid decarboxylase family protein [Celeribacter sp.]|uniref:UDP-glucuronic acid decarboxylase family protein n=1 Tax=Celeribacter sp. TaxID=1890673 RepID=UPI003A926E1E
MTLKRILVTGGAGFLGSHLVDRLIDAGHHVICFDDFSSGQRSNVAHLADDPRFELVEGDVTAPFDFEVDAIYNLACPASPPQYQVDPIRTLKIATLGTLHALELAHRRGARLFQASTSEVYGDPDRHPQDETYTGSVDPTGPRACYDEGKRAAEALCFDFQRVHGVDVRVARIFNTYGPRMHPGDGRVVTNFIAQALTGAPLTLYGGGTQTRSFCYVDDLIEGFVLLMELPDTSVGPVNLGNPSEITVRDLAEVVCALAGVPLNIASRALPVDDPTRRCPDITKARALLGWEPHVTLDEGLRRTIAHLAPRVPVLSKSL